MRIFLKSVISNDTEISCVVMLFFCCCVQSLFRDSISVYFNQKKQKKKLGGV